MSGESTGDGGFFGGVVDALKSISVKDLFAGYATIEQLKINSGMAKSQNNVAEWNAQAQLLSLQQQQLFNQQQLAAQQNPLGNKTLLMIAALAVVAVGVYAVVK